MVRYAPPPILFQGTYWSSLELTELALAWRNTLDKAFRVSRAPIAMVMANHPEAVALFFALSSSPAPLILLPPEAPAWRSAPPIPAGTRLVLPPRLRGLAAEAEQIGLLTTVLPDPESSRSADDAPFLSSPGIVLFTSGSTDLPRPVYRSTARVLDTASAVMAMLGTPRGAGVIATLPLSRAFGLHHGLMAAIVLGSPLALLDRFDHNAVLRLFASRRYQYWAGTPIMADVLSRSPRPRAHPAPPTCVIGGRLSAEVSCRFEERFGVPLRQLYGTTETGSVTVDAGTCAAVRSDTAGLPIPGVELRISDDPRAPLPAGTPGRIWLSTRYMMEGYGFPPNVKPPQSVDGWWPTPDVGHLDEAGYLTVVGRVDDCFRTDAGHLVNPATVAAALEDYPGVTDVAVVPLATATGPVLGVLVQSAEALRVTDLRRHLAQALPVWAQPRVLEATRALPRLSSGRADRRACIEILEKILPRGGA
jgi:long-chain acyl-CoA synthetase